MTGELEELEEGPKVEINIELLKKTLKKILNWKTPGYDWIRQTSTRNEQMLPRWKVPDWKTKGKTTLIQKNLSKRTAPNNYRPITYLSMMWKILTAQIREEIYISLTSCSLFTEEQKICRKGSRCSAVLLYIDQHILSKSKTRRKKPKHGLDWQQKSIWYGSAKLDNKVSQNVQNIAWSQKLHRENHKNLESWIDSRRKKLGWNKDPKKYFLRRCTITLIIHNRHDDT